nr:interleukin-1 alpha isoform X2 [Microcebus murinus]
MARVPDLFEDLKNCYSENEEYSSAIDHLSLNQKSFYDASYSPHCKDYMGQFMSLSTFETSKTSKFTFKESMVVVADNGKVLKKRRLSLNQHMTDDDLEAIVNNSEEDIIEPRSAASNFLSNMSYRFKRIIKDQVTLNDTQGQTIVRAPSNEHLWAAAINNKDDAVKFDMGAYVSRDDSKIPVTLRISKTQLFVCAQDEDQPVLLKRADQKEGERESREPN